MSRLTSRVPCGECGSGQFTIRARTLTPSNEPEHVPLKETIESIEFECTGHDCTSSRTFTLLQLIQAHNPRFWQWIQLKALK